MGTLCTNGGDFDRLDLCEAAVDEHFSSGDKATVV